MRLRWLLAPILALGAAGCTDTADLVPVNPQAQAVGSPRLHFIRGIPGAPMKVTMPDGETLPGSFSIDESPAAAAPGGPGNFAASARGPRTQLACHGNLVAGHGTADCQDQNGATYKLQI